MLIVASFFVNLKLQYPIAMRYFKLLLIFSILFISQVRSLFAQKSEDEDSTLIHRLANFGELFLSKLTYERPAYFVAVYPTAGFSRRTGVEFGVMPILGWHSKDEEKRLNTLGLTAQLSSKSMIEIRADADLFFSNGWRLNSKLEYLKVNDRFWGVYSNPDIYDAWRFVSKRFKGSVEVYKLITGHWFLGMDALGGNWKNEQWTFLPSEGITGVYGGDSFGLGPVLMMDSRDDHLSPHRGAYLKSSYKYYFNQWNSGDGFSNFITDLRVFLPISENVIAFQGLMELSAGDVPYYLLPELGGKYRLRGLDHSRRIVDKSVWLIRSEFRSHLWWRIGTVLFIESGGAGNRFLSDIGAPIVSGGGGLRLRIFPEESLSVRLDGAVASGGFYGISLSLKEAF